MNVSRVCPSITSSLATPLPDGTPSSSNGEAAEVLNNYQSVLISESDTVEISHSSVNQLSEVSINEFEILEAL